MANYNQLRVLNDTQANAIKALGNGLAVAELVKIYWPSPTGAKVYAWWDLLNDPLYSASNLTTWLDGAPLIPAFIAQDEAKQERFHEIPRTAAIGDDVVRMRFTNHDGAFEELCATHYAGVKVEIFYHFPNVGDGLTVHWFSGHLRTPDNVDADFVDITITEGLRSADLQLPNRVHAGQCTFAAQFGGRFDPLLPGNPCDYDKHTGGTRGLLDGATPFTSCDGSKASCLARMGDLLSYGGFDAITDTSYIGQGSNTTVSETKGQTTRMKEPVGVAYGEAWHNNLPLLDFAKEYNRSHPDEGTIRALFEISEGPIEEVTDFELMDEPLPRTDGLGLEVRLGTQGQSATTYSTSVLNYNRLAHARADKNPWDPNGVQPSSIVAKCKFKGRNTIRIYSDESTYTEGYTNLRAWVMLDLMRDTTYGHREAVERHHIPDLIRWAATGDTFGGVAQGKSAQQQITDICLGGKRFLPFMHKDATQTLAQWRWLGIEEYDLDDPDIPEFTDTGANRNILFDGRGLSRIKVSRRDDDKIPNEWTLTFNDAEHKSLERPLLFPDADAQKRAGEVYGDGSLRKVPDTETAFGVTSLSAAQQVGWYLLDYGRFYSGGIKNNGTVEFVTSHLRWPEALDLHQNKVIKITSSKLNNLKDPDGNVFTHFIVQSLTTTARGELVVTCQAYGALRAATGGGITCGDVTWENNTFWSVSGNTVTAQLLDAYDESGATNGHNVCYVQTAETISADGEYFEFTLPNNGTGGYPIFIIGISAMDGPACDPTTIFPGTPDEYSYCFFFYPSIYFYAEGNYLEAYSEWDSFTTVATGLSVASDTVLKLQRNSDTEIEWFVDGSSVGTWNAADPLPPLRLIAVAGTQDAGNQPKVTATVCASGASAPGTGDTYTGGGGGTITLADTRVVLIDRIWRDQELNAGVPGVYVAAGPESADAWAGFELWREVGSYSKVFAGAQEAIIGEAISVLAGTSGGSETVDVELLPGQELPSSGYVWLGAELFNYGAVTQLDTDPNQWRLSTLTNRGDRCTTAAMALHSIGDAFALLDASNVIWLPLEGSEIGQTRNYKAITDGQVLADVSAVSHTFDAPNFQLTTPADFAGTPNPDHNTITWTWTPISDSCIAGAITYEVHSDNTGSNLLWSGNASQWIEQITASGSVTRYFRARTAYDTGAWVSDSATGDFTALGGSGAVTSVFTRTGNVVATSGDYDAEQITFDPAGLAHTSAVDVQTAIEHHDTAIENRQPLDTDLTAIAALTPSDDDIIQRKAGAWANRTVAQYATDLKPQLPVSIIIAIGGETDAITTGTSKFIFRMPFAITLTEVRASLATAQTSGSIFTVDINDSGASVLSTKLTIDNTEKTSTTAATAAVISDTALANDAEISIDVDQIGDGTAKGLKVTLIGHRA